MGQGGWLSRKEPPANAGTVVVQHTLYRNPAGLPVNRSQSHPCLVGVNNIRVVRFDIYLGYWSRMSTTHSFQCYILLYDAKPPENGYSNGGVLLFLLSSQP
jgi:hypothetical protein